MLVRLSAEELYRRGVEHGNAGRNAAARRCLTSALERTGDPDLEARIAGTLSYIAARTGDPAGAERLCRDALATTGVSAATAAILEGQLGLLAIGSGDWDAAISWLDRAIVGVGDDRGHRNTMYLNRSVAHMQAGHLAEARRDLELAKADFAVEGNDQDAAMAQHNLGYVALLEGDLVTALHDMTAAREIMQGDSAVNAAIGDLDRAEVLRDAGLTTEAERTLDKVARTLGAHGMRQARGEAEFNLARSLLTHDPRRAATVAGAAARRFRGLGSTSWAARAQGVLLRARLSDGQSLSTGTRIAATRTPPSPAEIEQAADELDGLGFAAEASALRLTRDLWQARHGAREDLPAPVPPPVDGSPLQVRLLADEVSAARAHAAGLLDDAREHAARGLDALTRWQLSFGSLDLQTSLAMHARGLLFEGMRSAVRSRSPEVLFEWSERARHLSQQVVPLRPPPDPELATELAELRSLRAENPDGWLRDQRASALHDKVRQRQWVSTGAAGLDERSTLADVLSSLDEGTAFATYLYDGSRITCLVVTPEGARVVDAGAWQQLQHSLSGLRADLDVYASVRNGPMAAVIATALDERLAELDHLLLRGPLALVGDSRLVLTTPGVLAGVPWTMLPGLRGRPFTLATSATRWLRDTGRPRPPGVGFVAGPGVARGEEEVATASTAWEDARILSGSAATVDAVAALAGDVGTLHVAAHGRHAVDNPLFSGLDLADGALFGYDIDRIPRVPTTVVLSACEVGRSSVRWGEEAIGMTRTWLHAGTACVVAAPVTVADDAACELLGAMHAGLASGLPASEALARASLETGVVAPFQCHGSGF